MSATGMLSNEPRRSGKFVNFKNGKLVNSGQEYTSVTGKIVFFQVTDEKYQEREYRKMNLTLRGDAGDELILGFSLSSGYGMNFISMLPNIDLSKAVKISGGLSDPKEKSMSGYGKMFIAQQDDNGDWKSIKHFYASKSEKRLPEGFPIKDRMGKIVGMDWSNREQFIEILLAKWEVQIVKANGKYEKPAEDPGEPANSAFDDMPWD